jgi:bacteriocin-like protein
VERIIELNELTDEELSLVQGGGIGSFLTQLGQDIKDMLSTGHSGRGDGRRNSGMAASDS